MKKQIVCIYIQLTTLLDKETKKKKLYIYIYPTVTLKRDGEILTVRIKFGFSLKFTNRSKMLCQSDE